MKTFLRAIACLLALLLLCAVPVAAEETADAQDISKKTKVSIQGFKYSDFLFDKKHTCYWSGKNVTIDLSNSQGIGSLYLIFNYEYGEYTVTDNDSGQVLTAGTYGFLHEFLDLEAAFGTAPTSVTLRFENGSLNIGEIYVYSSGQVPDTVQKWQPPLESGADILMLPTHSDDDHLYFAGLLPYYTAERGLNVQVVYMTSHGLFETFENHRFHHAEGA